MLQYLEHLVESDLEISLRPMAEPQYIYRLDCPVTGDTCYIGLTSNPKRRLKDHCKGLAPQSIPSDDSIVDSPKREWIAALRAQGLKPLMEILEEVNPPEQVVIRELRWFLHYLQAGAPLTNGEMMYSRFLSCIAQSMTCDFLNEPVGSEVWSDLQWAMREDYLCIPWYYPIPYPPQCLLPIEYATTNEARKQGRFSIEAWAPIPETHEILWSKYRLEQYRQREKLTTLSGIE